MSCLSWSSKNASFNKSARALETPQPVFQTIFWRKCVSNIYWVDEIYVRRVVISKIHLYRFWNLRSTDWLNSRLHRVFWNDFWPAWVAIHIGSWQDQMIITQFIMEIFFRYTSLNLIVKVGWKWLTGESLTSCKHASGCIRRPCKGHGMGCLWLLLPKLNTGGG